MSADYRSQHEPPAFTLATIGHPANGRVIVKTTEGYWRNVHDGRMVDDEDFRAGWQPLMRPLVRQDDLADGQLATVSKKHIPGALVLHGPDGDEIAVIHDERDLRLVHLSLSDFRAAGEA